MDYFNYRDGRLFAEDVDLAAQLSAWGTPAYIYSRATLERHWRAFDDALQGRQHLVCYAVKANSNIAVLNVLAQLGSGFDIVSVGELERVLKAGGSADKIVFSGVGKIREEIERALDMALQALKDGGVNVVPVNLTPLEDSLHFWGPIVAAEAVRVHTARFKACTVDYGPLFAGLLEQGRALTPAYLAEARAVVHRSVSYLTDVFTTAPMTLLPSAPGPAPLLTSTPKNSLIDLEALAPALKFAEPFNFSGAPCVCFPAGLAKNGLPLGLQLAGPAKSEPQLVAVGKILEKAFPEMAIPS